MFYQVVGYLFGLIMALHYYFTLIFFPTLLDTFLGDD